MIILLRLFVGLAELGFYVITILESIIVRIISYHLDLIFSIFISIHCFYSSFTLSRLQILWYPQICQFSFSAQLYYNSILKHNDQRNVFDSLNNSNIIWNDEINLWRILLWPLMRHHAKEAVVNFSLCFIFCSYLPTQNQLCGSYCIQFLDKILDHSGLSDAIGYHICHSRCLTRP